MAKIVITIEDNPQGGVKVTSNPTFETMAKMVNSGGHDVTSAHGYALKMVNAALKTSKEKDSSIIMQLPKVKYL
jgi:hypothetical protein